MFKKQTLLVSLLATFSLVTTPMAIYAKDDTKKQQKMPPVIVETATAKQQEWQQEIEATGTMSSFQGIMVKPEVSGRVTEIYFESGTFIEKDKPLVQIYPDILEAELERNEAAYALAKADYERGLELYQKRVISKQDLDNLASTLQQSKATVEQTKAQLVQHNIAAPFSGLLGLRLVDVGDHISVGQNIVNLQKIDPIRVDFSVPEVYLSQLRKNEKVQIVPSSNKTAVYEGTVYAFDSAVDPGTRSLAMRARVPNEDHRLLPGMFVQVTLFAGDTREVLTIPQTAIIYSASDYYVYKVENGEAKKTKIKVGTRREQDVEVVEGLKAGDIVVSAGQVKLFDGSPVVTEAQAKAMQAQKQQPASKK